MRASRSTVRWVLIAAVLFAVCWATYQVLVRETRFEPGAEGNQLLLTALSLGLIILALSLAGVLIRNLAKLVVEHKRGILGAKLRTKLVFFYLILVLVPAIVLFSGSAKVIKETVEAILRFPDLTRQSRELVDAWRESYQTRCLSDAQQVAGEIREDGLLEAGQADRLRQRLERWRESAQLELIWVLEGDDVVVRVDAGESHRRSDQRERLRELAGRLALRVQQQGRPLASFDRLGGALLAHAAAPVDDQRSVATAVIVPPRLAAAMASVVSADEAHRRFRVERADLVRFYLTLIGLIFLVVLFVATWIGFYLARRITGPILELAAAAREISAGNLGVRVAADVGDELGTLVEAFNEMAGELQENRAVITRSTADLRRSNRALDERRRYIETLLAGLSVGVVSLDAGGRVTTANPAVERILALSLPPGTELVLELRRAGLMPLVRLLERAPAERPEGARHDLELSTPAGTQQVAVQVSPLRGVGAELLGTLITVEDLTQLLRAQRALAWQEVARRLAHEIKNPLTPIQLAAQRIRKKFNERADDLPRVLSEATASIEREVAGLKHLVDEFSRFARLPEVRLQPAEFTRVVESVIALYEGLPGVEWELSLDRSIGEVLVDAQQLRRALINLIDNALAAMDGRGTIRIATRGDVKEGWIRLEVADSGPGIPPGDRDKMFVPYFSTKPRGSGLGLAIVHRVITEHHGTIRVEDNQPRGARFVIEIPA